LNFTDEPMIQKGLEEIAHLQRMVRDITKIVEVKGDDVDLAIDYLHVLYACVDKEHNMYTRLQLCDNIDAKRFREQLDKEALLAGMPKDVSIPDYCYHMKEDIKVRLSDLGQELNEELDLDFLS